MGADQTVNRGQGSGAGGQGAAAVVAGTVLNERPSAVFEVVLDTQQRIRAHLVGEGQRNFVRLVPGDRVQVELMPHDPTRGRIQRKL